LQEYCFFAGFAPGGLFRFLIIFTAASNPLPNIKVGSLEKQISRLTGPRQFGRE
jgi:hypothetical protein